MFNYLSKIKFYFGFVNSGSFYTGALIDFYNLICVFLILIIFLIGSWIIFILLNYTFKKILLLNTSSNLNNFILTEKNNWRTLVNTNLNDKSFSYISITSIADYPQLEGSWCILPLSAVMVPFIINEPQHVFEETPVELRIITGQDFWIFYVEAKASPGLVEGDDADYFFFKSDLYKLFDETYGDADAFYEGLSKLHYHKLSRIEILKFDNHLNPSAKIKKVVLPVNKPINLMARSMNMDTVYGTQRLIIPELYVLKDAVWDRYENGSIIIEKPGIYWGLCIEANANGSFKSFIPIMIEVADYSTFLKYALNND